MNRQEVNPRLVYHSAEGRRKESWKIKLILKKPNKNPWYNREWKSPVVYAHAGKGWMESLGR